MSKNTSSDNKSQGVFSNPTVMIALIGTLGTIIAALIGILPLLTKSAEPTVVPTAPPAVAFTETVPPTVLPTNTPTEVPPTGTATEIPPTPTETIMPSPTPVDPGIACLNRWNAIPSNSDLTPTVARGDCASADFPGIGISTTGDELIFGKNNFREQGVFGISTDLPEKAVIRMKVKLTILTQGEFWIALSDTPTPENNMMIIALQSKNGEVRTYINQTNSSSRRLIWDVLKENTTYGDGPPYIYNLVIRTSGSQVDTRINQFDIKPAEIVNLPKYLFIGYLNKSNVGSASMNITVSDFSIELGE